MDRPKVFFNQTECLFFFEIASNHKHDVVDAVIFLVKTLKLINWNSFDICSVANGGLAIIVPIVSSGKHALTKDSNGIIFATLELISYNGHFRKQIFSADKTVEQTVCFESDCKFKIVAFTGERFEVVGTIHPSGTIHDCSTILQCLGNIWVKFRTFKNHVLKKVSHTAFAITFVPRADKNGCINSDFRCGRIRVKKNLQPISHFVFGDIFNGSYFFDG